ncbi:flavin reductase [Methylobacterium nigriterrae]|uniref:flavin reductase n=1 Tax=Methylobacterium nigriterrae TaxID=3127512 RepID=UPI00301404FA
MESSSSAISASRFREVLGQYPTGVAVITACSVDGTPVGMVVGSFGSTSLDPPLISFMPDKKSSSWLKLQQFDKFCVNILGAHQLAVCRDLASKRPDKFAEINWSRSDLGNPVIAGSIAQIECVKETEYEAGDHLIVLGRVLDLALGAAGTPLLFYRGGYGTFTAQSMISGEAEILDKLRLLDRIRPMLEGLASEFDTEVTAVALVKGEINLVGSFGRSRAVDFPTRVGQRLPFMPPVGGVFAAWGTPEEQSEWLSRCGGDASLDRQSCLRMIENIRSRGCAVGFGHEASLKWERAAFLTSIGDATVTEKELRQLLADAAGSYNPGALGDDRQYEFHFAQAPVFNASGNVVLGITIWGPEGEVSRETIEAISGRLIRTAAAATRCIGGETRS